MTALALTILSRLSPVVLVAVGIVIFYEGAPLGPLRFIPVVGPALELVTDGRVDRARKDGAVSERVAWEEARRRMLAEQEKRRAEQQAAINRAEADYLAQKSADNLTIQALEDALSAEKTDAPAAVSDRPAFSRRVSRALNQVGRD